MKSNRTTPVKKQRITIGQKPRRKTIRPDYIVIRPEAFVAYDPAQWLLPRK